MSNIWLDVTTILSWQRPAVGIVRVEAECAAYALAFGGKIRFCCFDGGEKIYREVLPQDVQTALSRIRGQKVLVTSESQMQSVVIPSAVSKEARVKIKIMHLISLLPKRMQRAVWNFAVSRRDAFNAALRGYREIRHALKISISPPQQHMHIRPSAFLTPVKEVCTAIFGQGDVYISLGLDWDQKDLVLLYELKKKVDLKVLLFCYDIIPVKLPHLCVGDVAALFACYFSDVAWCADEVLCISECSKRDLQELLVDLGTPIPSMSVVRLGCQLPAAPENASSSPSIAELLVQRYILFVSTIERRKNHEVLYRAYTRLLDQGEKDLPLLIFVGMSGWGTNELLADLKFDPRIKKYIKIFNHVDDADLMQLYRNAYFTVYPSLYEGWGLPVAESLAAGKFCLASHAASIPEVGGDLLEYLDPWDVPKWTERLKWYFDHPQVIEEMCLRIRKEYKPHAWKDTASYIFTRAEGLAENEGKL